MRLLALALFIPLLIGCTIVRQVHTGPGKPTSYYVSCYADMANCLDRAMELCPSGYNVNTMSEGGDRKAVIIACQERDVPVR